MYKTLFFYVCVILFVASEVFAIPGDIKKVAGSLDTDYTGRNFEWRWYDATGVFIDENYYFYIADATKHRIVKMEPDSTISNIAGTAWPGYSGDGEPAILAELNAPSDVLKTPQGEILIADTGNHCIRKIDKNGIIHTIAGIGNKGYSGDNGPAYEAQLSNPQSIFIDQNNHIYITDTGNHRIRKIDANSGIITTIVGDGFKDENGNGRFTGDNGPATQASLSYPMDICVDSIGTIYIADSKNKCIRKVATSGQITTLPSTLFPQRAYTPKNLLIQNNNLFFSDFHLYRLNLLSGVIDTIKAQSVVLDIFEDTRNNIYISNGRDLIKFTPYSFHIAYKRQRTIQPQQTFYGDNQLALEAGIYKPRSIWVDSLSNIYIADTGNHRIRKVTPTGQITTIAGNEKEGFFGDGGPATQASLSKPYDICGDRQGNLYIADMGNNRIRKVDAQGIISTVAGNGESISVVQAWMYYQDPPKMPEDVKDGHPATQALLRKPMGVSIDSSDHLYIADTGHHRIRKVDASGVITTVVGNGFGQRPTIYDVGSRSSYLLGAFSGDGGPAQSAHLQNPVDICFDQNQNLYIADTGNHRIRMVDSQTNTITTIAGNGDTFRVFGELTSPSLYVGNLESEEYPAISSSLNFPMSVCATATGHVFIADSYNHRIRVILPQSGVLKTIAGSSYKDKGDNQQAYPEFVIGFYFMNSSETGGYSGDNGPAISAKLNTPSKVFIDRQGDLYIADTNNFRIRVIEGIEQTLIDTFEFGNIEKSDFNHDKTVNFLDFIIFAIHFNSKKGESNFNIICDLNVDGIIGFLDFLGFAENFGKSYP